MKTLYKYFVIYENEKKYFVLGFFDNRNLANKNLWHRKLFNAHVANYHPEKDIERIDRLTSECKEISHKEALIIDDTY